MRFDFISSCGNAKYVKLRLDDGSVEFPTLMNLKMENGKENYWIIGDLEDTISMNFPQSSIEQNSILSLKVDLSFIANFLMHRTIDDKIINDFLLKTIEEIESNIKTISKEKSVVLIQPTDSNENLKKIIDVIIKNQIKHVGITNFIPLLTNPFKAIEFLGSLRSQLPFDTILYLLTPVPHTFIPILTYAGIDVFSDGFTSIATKQDLYLTDFGGYSIGDVTDQVCFCEACNKLSFSKQPLKINSKNRDLLAKHNSWIFMKKIREIRHAFKMKDLRSYVEMNLSSNPFSASCLKLLDKNWSNLLVNRTATWLPAQVKHITTYSYYRPAVKEYQRRIRDRFQIKETKKVIVLFPCSARKPYSESKSHQRFLKVLNNLDRKKRGYIQELILTSPLGIIPRELETVYPAAHYDIPVTGDWSQEEVNIAVNQLTSVIRNQNSSQLTVIAHVANEYLELCELAEKELGLEFIYSSKETRTTSRESLNSLKENLERILDDLPPINYSIDTERLHALVDYQFGKNISFLMFPDKYHITGKPYQNSLVFRNRKQMGVIQRLTGQLSLTLETARILVEKKQYYIKFEGTELKGSTLFAVGVIDADPQIRPTDAVVIIDENDQLTAVGHAIVSGNDMLTMASGQVAKIKQRRKS
jgi:archaeosine synthase